MGDEVADEKTEALREGKFQVKVEGEGVDRTVVWQDRRMWPYECDVCHEWVDEPDDDNFFSCYAVVVGCWMGIACSAECCDILKDSEQVAQALEDGRSEGL